MQLFAIAVLWPVTSVSGLHLGRYGRRAFEDTMPTAHHLYIFTVKHVFKQAQDP